MITVAGHDTASAAAAVPFVDEQTAFISSGTLSVFGQVLDKPLTTQKALKYGFANEFGLDSMLFVKNMMGLYLFENLRRSFIQKGQKISYSQMVRQAKKAKPFRCFLDMSSPLFFAANDTETLVRQLLHKTKQSGPVNLDEIMRVLLEGLAFSYREALEQFEETTGRKLSKICMVGGGIRNTLLCQMAADATGLEVIAGPAEATISGNLAIQALATKQLRKAAEIRELISNSFNLKKYKPKSTDLWNKNYVRYKEMLKKSMKLK